jgi:hypothetical protein
MHKIIWLIALIPALVYTWLPYPHNIQSMAWVLIIGQTYVGTLFS